MRSYIDGTDSLTDEGTTQRSPAPLTPEHSERQYWKASQRRFPPGNRRLDWLEAERAIEQETQSLGRSDSP